MANTKSAPASSFARREAQRKMKQSASGIVPVADGQRPFTRINFILMGCCVVMIVLGFLLMTGGGSSVEGGFNPDIFSTRRIVVGPTLAFLGFLSMAFAIIYTPHSMRGKRNDNPGPSES